VTVSVFLVSVVFLIALPAIDPARSHTSVDEPIHGVNPDRIVGLVSALFLGLRQLQDFS